MIRLAIFASAFLLSAPAFAGAQMVPPSPGTIEDPNIPVKLVADGPPRPLIRIDLPDTPAKVAVAVSTVTATR